MSNIKIVSMIDAMLREALQPIQDELRQQHQEQIHEAEHNQADEGEGEGRDAHHEAQQTEGGDEGAQHPQTVRSEER